MTLGEIGTIIGIMSAFGAGMAKYVAHGTYKSMEKVRNAEKNAAKTEADAFAANVREQHRLISDNVKELSGKVDELKSTVDRTLGIFEGLDVDNRLNRHDERIGVLERSNTGDGPYRARQKHSR